MKVEEDYEESYPSNMEVEEGIITYPYPGIYINIQGEQPIIIDYSAQGDCRDNFVQVDTDTDEIEGLLLTIDGVQVNDYGLTLLFNSEEECEDLVHLMVSSASGIPMDWQRKCHFIDQELGDFIEEKINDFIINHGKRAFKQWLNVMERHYKHITYIREERDHIEHEFDKAKDIVYRMCVIILRDTKLSTKSLKQAAQKIVKTTLHDESFAAGLERAKGLEKGDIVEYKGIKAKVDIVSNDIVAVYVKKDKKDAGTRKEWKKDEVKLVSKNYEVNRR